MRCVPGLAAVASATIPGLAGGSRAPSTLPYAQPVALHDACPALLPAHVMTAFVGSWRAESRRPRFEPRWPVAQATEHSPPALAPQHSRLALRIHGAPRPHATWHDPSGRRAGRWQRSSSELTPLSSQVVHVTIHVWSRYMFMYGDRMCTLHVNLSHVKRGPLALQLLLKSREGAVCRKSEPIRLRAVLCIKTACI